MSAGKSYQRLTGQAIDEMERSLRSLVGDVGALCAMFVDESGYILAVEGRALGGSPVDLAAIAAGCFRSLSMLTGRDEMTVDFHDPETPAMFFTRVSRSALLMVLYDSRAEALSIRARARAEALRTREIVSQNETSETLPVARHFIMNKLDELFDEDRP